MQESATSTKLVDELAREVDGEDPEVLETCGWRVAGSSARGSFRFEAGSQDRVAGNFAVSPGYPNSVGADAGAAGLRNRGVQGYPMNISSAVCSPNPPWQTDPGLAGLSALVLSGSRCRPVDCRRNAKEGRFRYSVCG